MPDLTNPYAPPATELAPAALRRRVLAPASAPARPWRGRCFWLVLFALNLSLPLMLAANAGNLSTEGWVGLGLAVLALGGLGLGLLLACPRIIDPAVLGVLLTAVAQGAPALQWAAIGVGEMAASSIPGLGFSSINGSWGMMAAFVVAFVAGLVLLGMGLLGGVVIATLGRLRWDEGGVIPPASAPTSPQATTES